MQGCLYDCQGNLVCRETFANTPSPAAFVANCGPRFDNQSCSDGMFCIEGTCKRGDERDDLMLGAGTKCDYSGRGVDATCAFSKTDPKECGISKGYKRCDPGLYCTDAGQCVSDKPVNASTNCTYFSGVGIANCARKVSSDKCGPNNGYRVCAKGLYCTDDGVCTSDASRVSNMPDNCKLYSGDGIINCKSIAAPSSARVTKTPTASPAGPYTYLYDKLVNIPKTATTIKSIDTLDSCQTNCTNSTKCSSFFYDSTKKECTPLTYNKSNINSYVSNNPQKGITTIAYKNA